MTNAKFYFWGIVAAVAFFQFNNAIPANALPIGIKEDLKVDVLTTRILSGFYLKNIKIKITLKHLVLLI